jgi:hypothetical protein
VVGTANGIGTSAQFTGPVQLAFSASGSSILVADFGSNSVRSIDMATRAVSTAAGSGAVGSVNGAALAATFSDPYGIAVNASGAVFIADNAADNIRLLFNGQVSTFAGGGASIEGPRTSVVVTSPQALAMDALGRLIVPSDNRVRMISPNGQVKTLAGSGAASVLDGIGTMASFNVVRGIGLAPSGTIYVTDNGGSYVRQLVCVPCPASFFCASGVPVLCPAGSACPLSTVNASLCPAGTFSAAGASSCSPCPAGSFSRAPGSAGCQPCPGGHFCPARTSSWARLNCGLGSWCPEGSAAPSPCPVLAVPAPFSSWAQLPQGAQGPAFLVEVASCLNHCFWNSSAGGSSSSAQLSKC